MTDSALTPYDFHLLAEGTHGTLYDKLGAHPLSEGARTGTRFAVWAPNAESVDVIGDWTDWQAGKHRLEPVAQTGVWQGFVPGVGAGRQYKYRIRSRFKGYTVDKADPFAFATERPPATASVIADLKVRPWHDQDWMATRRARNALDAPMSIYEVHLGSWRRDPSNSERILSYGELAPMLVEHVRRTGFTHVELMPVAEHPFYASWGYQVTSFFAPSARYGTPADLMALIDTLHQAGIGVILDWTPAHFPTDEHGLIYFDGTHLYEHADPRQGIHAEWGSAIFNYGRNEVRSFLISNANFWLDRYHIDGLRVDAVASMLHLDYGRKQGEWIPNKYGGREDLAAVEFLRITNESIYRHHPDVQTMAEESTSWPMVSRPTYLGGLGFGLKWDMGWMHDTLDYMSVDPVFRRYHHHKLTFRGMYAFSENFVLPLSHDEVVHGKGSLLNKMPGDFWQKFASLRLLYAYMWALPGKKLLFMGCEFGQWREWSHDRSLDWHLLNEGPHHRQLHGLRGGAESPVPGRAGAVPAGLRPGGLRVDRRRRRGEQHLRVHPPGAGPGGHAGLPVQLHARAPVRLPPGVARGRRRWVEVLNTDAGIFGGSNLGNLGGLEAQPVASHGRAVSGYLTLPPLSAVFLKPA